MKRLTPLAMAMALAYSASASAALLNGNFAEYDPPADGSTAGYDEGEGPPSWYVTATESGGSVVYDAAGAATTGGYWLYEPPITTGFGASKFEQCVPVTDAEPLEISYSVFADTPTSDATALAIRVNPNFYANLEDCLEAQATDSGGDRLSAGGARPNDDVDFTLGADDGNQWIVRTPDQEPNLRYTTADIPDGTRFMNLSMRARDRPDGGRTNVSLRLDDIRVVQGGVDRVVNGSFTHAPLFDGAPLVSGGGWVVNRDGNTELKAAVGPAAFALSGDNVFYFETLTGNFGLNGIDQCFSLDDADIRPSLFALTQRPDEELQIRVNIDFYRDADCSVDAASGLRIREDFALDGDAGEWIELTAGTSRGPGEYGDATHALLSIRARDRTNAAGDGPGEFARAIYIDDVSVAAGVSTPTFSPPPGSFVDSVTVTLSSSTPDAVIYYTLDGSDPDDTSANVPSGGTVEITSTSTLTARAFADNEFSGPRAGDYTITAPPPPPPPPPRELSTGCSISDRPSPLDPTLWVLAALAAGGLLWRRRREARADTARS